MKTEPTLIFNSAEQTKLTPVRFICDKILYCRQFVEYCTDKYFTNCDTFEECVARLKSEGMTSPNRYKFSQMEKIPAGSQCVVVEFSTEEDYTIHETFIIPIPDEIVTDFIKRMRENI